MTTETISRPLILIYLNVLRYEETDLVYCLLTLFNRTEVSFENEKKNIKSKAIQQSKEQYGTPNKQTEEQFRKAKRRWLSFDGIL